MEPKYSSETTLNSYQITQCHIIEDSEFNVLTAVRLKSSSSEIYRIVVRWMLSDVSEVHVSVLFMVNG